MWIWVSENIKTVSPSIENIIYKEQLFKDDTNFLETAVLVHNSHKYHTLISIHHNDALKAMTFCSGESYLDVYIQFCRIRCL